ncbi:DUF349 domain-containing protein [Actinotalea sp. Marseille-Q4924]|uniref:DUF349 domain-containing protein n=1 Tax=Actinotalea sp. Marseille-Q4924 TaxID=2866571 RepID=UPI001CE41B34|nr:DUF349 domain-containing protein [Actinotalea sp. Marseille-Q4924]
MSHDEHTAEPVDAAPAQEQTAPLSPTTPEEPAQPGADAASVDDESGEVDAPVDDESPVSQPAATDEEPAAATEPTSVQDTAVPDTAETPAAVPTAEEPADERALETDVPAEEAPAPEETDPHVAAGSVDEPAGEPASESDATEDATVVSDEPTEQPEAATAEEPAEQPETAPAPTTDESTEQPEAAAPTAPEPTEQPEAAPAATSDEEAEATPAPTAEEPAEPASPPGPRPVPRPLPRPAAPTPAAVAPAVSAPAAPLPPALTPAETAEAARWGRVDDDGTVWVREETGERVVGQYPDADPTEALAFYVRRYADLHAKVVLFEARLAATDLAVKEIDTTLTHLGEELAEPAAVGDLAALRARLDALRSVAAERRAAAEAERAAARETAVAERTAIVEAAEKIAATDPDRMQWRPAGEQLRTLLDRWKDAQRHGPRLDRGTEDALWKRFSHARSAFDRERRRWFSELEKRNAGAKAEKEALVAEAERLSSSTDWGATSAAYRDLMTKWKSAGRASRKDDDALWARFRGAQDVFFAARDASQRQTDEEYAANLEVKLRLLEEAERLVPVTDLGAAKAALRDLQDRWERAGKVPRNDVQRVEGRLRAVEQAVRDADQAQWRRTNPETRARAEGAAAQLYAAIAGLEADLETAKGTGDARKVAEAQAALDARRAWLEQIERAAQEARG